MRRGAGKAKGSAFERQVAKELSLWLTGGKDGKQLIRSVLSGGWSAGRQTTQEGWRQVGDLAPNGPTGEEFRKRYAVECKHRRDIDLYGIWTRSDAIVEWWDKLKKECGEVRTPQPVPTPILIFRANSRPIMVGTTPTLASYLRINNAAWFRGIEIAIFPFDMLLRCSPARVLTGTIEG